MATVIHSKQQRESSSKNSDIKQFIDFFYEACKRIRGEKAKITRGKDGMLVKLALRKLSESQLEQLAIWFLEKKKSLKSTIGAMLSKLVLETLKQEMTQPDFWKKVNGLYNKYYKRPGLTGDLASKFKPFTPRQITEIQEQVARIERAANS